MELLPALANASGWAVAVGSWVIIFRALTRGDLVSGAEHRRAVKREEFWRDRALTGTQLAETAVDVAEAATDAD